MRTLYDNEVAAARGPGHRSPAHSMFASLNCVCFLIFFCDFRCFGAIHGDPICNCFWTIVLFQLRAIRCATNHTELFPKPTSVVTRWITVNVLLVFSWRKREARECSALCVCAGHTMHVYLSGKLLEWIRARTTATNIIIYTCFFSLLSSLL